MLTSAQILTFLLTAMLLTATPGPDNLMVLGVGMSRGRRAGVAFGLGCAVGCLSHTVLAVLGVSALVAASPVAFSVLKVVGVRTSSGWACRLGDTPGRAARARVQLR